MMKIKYFLRGFGTGLIVATVLLFLLYSYQMSDVKVVSRAKELGMVYGKATAEEETSVENHVKEESKQVSEETTLEETTLEETTAEVEEKTTEPQSNSVVEVEFTISQEMDSIAVCEELQKYGIIDDANAFDKYLIEQGYEGRIQKGIYTLREGMSYEEIAKMLTK
ncbi:MAG: hypothetical protein SPF70_05295 [Lachnospiraceae bacterium]|nr:hypothetical protein [Lachnospiraceae bacterium]